MGAYYLFELNFLLLRAQDYNSIAGFIDPGGAADADSDTLLTPTFKNKIEVCAWYHFKYKIFRPGFNFLDVPDPVLNISCLCFCRVIILKIRFEIAHVCFDGNSIK